MTKAELEKEAEEYAIKSYGNDAFTQTHIPQMIEPVRMYLKLGYLAGAEPREKQIQIDAEQIRALQKQNGELTDRVRELEKENASLKDALEGYKQNAKWCDKCDKLSDLEKENAELKERVDNQKSFLKRIRVKFELGELEKKEIEGYLESEQLTKAKELIEKLLEEEKNNMYWEMNGSDKSSYYEVRKQAGQFLKENSIYERIQKAKYNYTD